MARRALVIGAQTFGLKGVGRDVETMAAALKGRGFAVRECEGALATRDGILAAYERLIADTSAGDAVVVYYSGHGGYIRPLPGEPAEVDAPYRQFIVPTDFSYQPGDDFRGITAVELSVLLGLLTRRTDNVVVILDCCHAAFMSRDLGAQRARRLPLDVTIDIGAHLRQLGPGLRTDLARRDGNDLAVRLVACADGQLAYELPESLDGTGDYAGVFTAALLRALQATDDARINWSTLIGGVRQAVQARIAHQRPEAAGPADRQLFQAYGEHRPDSLPVSPLGGDLVRLDGASLFGVRAGDTFLIMPVSATGPDRATAIAGVRVDSTGPVSATGRITDRPGVTVPPDARAFRDSAVARQIPVRAPAWFAPVLGRNTFVRPAGRDEPAAIEVRESPDGALTVHDPIGPLHDPVDPAGTGADRIRANVERVARATLLRAMTDRAAWTFAPPVRIGFGRVTDTGPDPLPLSGATLHTGDRVYLKVRNDGTEDLYLSLIDIGVSAAITVLTANAPSGHRLAPGAGYAFGTDWDDRLTGQTLSWPAGIVRAAARPETILAVLTSEPQDVSPLNQRGVRGRNVTPSAFRDLLSHFSGGGATREFCDPPLVCTPSVEFVLTPEPRRLT